MTEEPWSWEVSSLAWVALTLGLRGLGTESPTKSNPTRSDAPCSNGTGQAYPDGTTFETSTEPSTPSMFSPADFRAKTYRLPAGAPGSPASAPASSSSSSASQMALLDPGGFILLENVAGLLASHKGRDFAHVLAALAEVGFCDLAWRILDSRYFGVPQRRRRVFILGRRDRGRRCAEILLEPEGGGGDFEARVKTPARAAHRTAEGIARTLSHASRYDGDTEDFVVANTLQSRTGGGRTNDAADSYWVEDFRNGTLTADPGRTDRKPLAIVRAPTHANGMRTTPRAAGRLDGASVMDPPRTDGRRYAAVGDAVTVNVAEWIGWRLKMHEDGWAP
jgi:C-5 cytosine-specific DNA methylase